MLFSRLDIAYTYCWEKKIRLHRSLDFSTGICIVCLFLCYFMLPYLELVLN